MRIHLIIPALILLAAGAAVGQRTYEADLEGYVTRVASPREFDVNGVHVLADDKTQFYFLAKNKYTAIQGKELKLYVGQRAEVYGKLRKKEHAMTATQLDLLQQKKHEISGSGVIDAIPLAGADAPPESHLLRADGYVVLITKETALTFQPPMTADSAFRTNVWVSFHASQRADGLVVASKASFRENAVRRGEAKLRTKMEYDPSAVDSGAHQGLVSKSVCGIDPKQIPPYKDEAMHARVSAIGAKLIPKYQRELPDGDEDKINFRFHLVDLDGVHDALTLPSGIILVPHQVVERMQNDSQLATVLADNIASGLEKQFFQIMPGGCVVPSLYLAGLVGSAFVPRPGASVPALLAVGGEDKLMVHNMEQSGRVSLMLLHDAGYEIDEAPVAWWLLASRKPKGLEETSMPPRAEYLYKVLGENWHSD